MLRDIPHSRAPWKFSETAGCKGIKSRIAPRHYKAVATTVGLSNEAEDRANAAILEAAPDMLGHLRVLASYGCAGVDQGDPDDIRLCGKCGVCEAGKLLQRIERRARVRRR